MSDDKGFWTHVIYAVRMARRLADQEPSLLAQSQCDRIETILTDNLPELRAMELWMDCDAPSTPPSPPPQAAPAEKT